MVKQISILLENAPGQLAKACAALASEQINIRAMTIGETAEFAVLRLIVNTHKQAIGLLRENGFVVSESDVIAVELDDLPGALAQVAILLSKANINIDYVYEVAYPLPDKIMLAFRVGDTKKAESVLKKAGMNIVDDIMRAQK